jgi:glucokinase
MILAGDIGGTKTNLALYDWKTERVEPARGESYASADYASLEDILEEFLNPPPEPSDKKDDEAQDAPAEQEPLILDAACFGVAGPVIENTSKTTNLPWVVDGAALSKRFTIPHVRLLNDLEATAYGVLVLKADEVDVLNAGTPPKTKGAMALIAAGTGLGEAMLFWDGKTYKPMPSEGGHSSFAPTSDLEIDLLRYLRTQHTHVSYERVLSGMGLHAIYEFLRDTKKNEPTWLAEKIKVGDPAAIIAEAGLKKQAEIAVQTLDMFATIYGAEAGNLALKAMALDAVYVGGGIAPRLLAKLKDGMFMKAFADKGRYKKLLAGIPVRVITNPKAALLGAASVAAQLRKGSA